ncbi:MAG: response regulator transcription factor [Bacteroidota bacterium]
MDSTPEMPTFKLLVVDDDKVLSPMVAEYLESKGYEVYLSHNGQDALDLFVKHDIDFCVLDVRMPHKGGFELATELRQLSPQVPFLFLTSESHRDKRLEGLRLGADDYILKPFSMEELHLRIQAILRRTFSNVQTPKSSTLPNSLGKFNYYAISREIKFGEETIVLSDIENRLLGLFLSSADGFVSREVALKKIWNDDYNAHTISLNVYISKLRKILSRDSDVKLLNVHGSGYQLIVRSTTD